MIVQGGKTKKVKKPKKKKGNNGDNLAKETLKVAIANGTIKDLLWGEVIMTNQTESDESEEEDMEDHSVEVFNELLLRKSSMVHHPESQLLTKHRQSVIANHSTSTLPSMPESAFESTPPPLHMKGSMVDPSPRLKQTKVIQNIASSYMPGKQSQHPDTIGPNTSTSHSSGHQHKRRYSAEESRDYREVLTSSLDVKHRSRAFVDIMRTLKVATLEARRASSYVHSNTRDSGVEEGSDEEFLTAEELSVVQDNDVLWGGVAGSRKSRHTLTPGAARRTPASGPDALMMAELVHLSHSMRREREGVDPTGGTDGDVASVVESTHGSRRGSAGSRRGSRGDTAEGSERYLHYTGSNERLDRFKLKYDDGVELNHQAQVDAKYSAHMHATLQLKSSAAQHSVLNPPAHEHFSQFFAALCSENNKLDVHGVYERFTTAIPDTNNVTDREPGDVIDRVVEEVAKWSNEDTHTHEPTAELHGSSVSSHIIDTMPSPPHTAPLTTTLSADDDYISRIRRAYQNTDISDSDSSDSEASARSDDRAGARGTDLALSLPFGAESDTDSVSICLQSPTGTSSSVVEDILTPRREKTSNKRTPKQRRVKKLNAISTNNTTSANTTNIISDTTTTGTTNVNTTNITNSPSPRTSVRKSMTARLSRPSKYIPKVPAVPTSLLPAAPASTPPVPSSHDNVSADTTAQHNGMVFVADESIGVEVTLSTTHAVLDPPITAPDSTHTSPHTEILVLPTVPVSRSPKVTRKHASPAVSRKKPSSPLSLPTTLTSLSAQHTTLSPTQHTTVSTQQAIHTPLQTSLPTTPLIPVPPLIPHSNMNTTSATTTPLTSPQHFRTKTLPPPRAAVHASPVVRSRSFRTEVLSHNTHTHTAVYDTSNAVSHNSTHTTTAPVDSVNQVNKLYNTEMSDSWDEVNDAHERFLQPDTSADIIPNRSSGSANHARVSPVHSIVDSTTQYSSGVNNHIHSGADSAVHSGISSKTTINTNQSPTLLSTVYNEEYDAEYSDGFVIGSDSVGSSKLNSTSGTYSDKYNSGSMKYHSPLVSSSHSPHNMHYATHKQRDTITITDTTLDSVAAALENTHFYPIEHTTHTEYTPVVPEYTQYISPHISPTTHPTTQSPHTVHTTPLHSTQSPHTISTHTTQPVYTSTTDNTNNTDSTLPSGLEHLTGIWPYDSSLAAYKYVLHLYHTRQAAQQQRRQEHVREVRERRRVKQARQAYPVRHARSDTYQVLTFDPEHLNLVLTTHASHTAAPLHTVNIPISTTFITENSSGVTLRTTAHSVPRGYLASYSVSQWCSMQTEINSALAAFELSRFKLQGREVDAVVVEDGVVHGEGYCSVSSGVDNVTHHNTHNQNSVHNTSNYTNTSNISNITSSIPTHCHQATLHFDDEAVDNGVFLTSISPTSYTTYSGADGDVTMEQLRHYAEQGYASFVQLLQAREHVEPPQIEDIQPSSHRPVCIPTVFARSSGPIRPLLLSQRYTTHTSTDHAHTTTTVHNTTVQHSQPSRFLSLIKDAVIAYKEAQAEQRRLAVLHIQNTKESMHSPSTPLLYTTHISDETKRNFRYYDPHSSGIIYSNDEYTAEGSVVSGGSVQFAIEGHVCSGVGTSSTSGGAWSTPTVPRIPKQHTTRTRNRNTVGSSSIVHDRTITTSITSTQHTANTNINTVIVPTASTESMLKYTNNNNNNNSDYHTRIEGVEEVEQLLQMVLLVESRRDMQVHFAKTFLQLDMVVDVLASLSEAAMAVRENASLYGWILLNYADLLERGLQQALHMLRSDNASIVFDDESIHADTIGGGACEVVVYNASEATDTDIAIMQQGGVTYIMNEPYSLTTLKAIVQAHGLHTNQHESPELS